jgi:hypothetical protein
MSVLHDHGVIYGYFNKIRLLVRTVFCGTYTCYFVDLQLRKTLPAQAGNRLLQKTT